MNFFEKLQQQSSEPSKLLKAKKKIRKQVQKQKLRQKISKIKVQELNIGYKKKQDFNLEKELKFQEIAFLGAQKFLDGVRKLVQESAAARQEEAKPQEQGAAQYQRLQWKVLESSNDTSDDSD